MCCSATGDRAAIGTARRACLQRERLAVYSEAYRLRLPTRWPAPSPLAATAGRGSIRRARGRIHRPAAVAVRFDPLVRRSAAATPRSDRSPINPGSRSWPAGNGPSPPSFDAADANPSGWKPWRRSRRRLADAAIRVSPVGAVLMQMSDQRARGVQGAVRRADALANPSASSTSPQPWLIWRQELKTQYRSLAPDEAAALEAMRAGGNFGALCDTLCTWHEAGEVPMVAAGMLKRWIVEELLIRVSA